MATSAEKSAPPTFGLRRRCERRGHRGAWRGVRRVVGSRSEEAQGEVRGGWWGARIGLDAPPLNGKAVETVGSCETHTRGTAQQTNTPCVYVATRLQVEYAGRHLYYYSTRARSPLMITSVTPSLLKSPTAGLDDTEAARD